MLTSVTIWPWNSEVCHVFSFGDLGKRWEQQRKGDWQHVPNALAIKIFPQSCGILTHCYFLSGGGPKGKYAIIIFSKNSLKKDSTKLQPVLNLHFRTKEGNLGKLLQVLSYRDKMLSVSSYVKHRIVIHFLVSDWRKNLIKV